MIIRTINNLQVDAPFTYLSQLVSAGTNVFPWKSPIGNASWAVQFGATGENQSEILLFSSATPAGTAGTTTANSLYDHPADTPLYAIKYDQIVYERSTTGTAGTAVPISGGTVNIQCTGTTTFFDDTTGASNYAYKTYFQNSVTSVKSTESDWIIPGGFSFYSLGNIRQRVKDRLVSAGYIDGLKVEDYMINGWINEWQELMTNVAADVNEDYQMGTLTVNFAGTTDLGTITTTDFRGGFKRVWYSDGSGTYQASKMDSNTFSPNKTFTNTFPYFFMQGDNVIGRRPNDTTGSFICEYYKVAPILIEDTDQVAITMQSYTKSFVDYAHAQALFKDQKITESQMKLDEAYKQLEIFKRQIAPRNTATFTSIDIVEDTGNEQSVWLFHLPYKSKLENIQKHFATNY